MTRDEIILQVGRDLGDTSTNFVTDVLNPAFDFVLLDLAQAECIRPLRRTTVFAIRADARDYETREITGLTPHHPAELVSLTVRSWGLPWAVVPRAATDLQFEALRLAEGEAARGKWRLWRLYPNHRLLQVHPPADADNDGVECEVLFTVPPLAIAPTDDVLDIEAEDVGVILAGIKTHAASFDQSQAGQVMGLVGIYELAKRRMWGRRWNARPGRITPRDW